MTFLSSPILDISKELFQLGNTKSNAFVFHTFFFVIWDVKSWSAGEAEVAHEHKQR